MPSLLRWTLAGAAGIGLAAGAFAADLKVGLSVSLSGPNSSLGKLLFKVDQAARIKKKHDASSSSDEEHVGHGEDGDVRCRTIPRVLLRAGWT